MEFEKLYREIKTCPWCLGKPTLTVTPYPNKVTFNVRLGCRNIKSCLFNPYQELTCSLDELDSCVDEIIDNWNGRTENSVPPSQVNITIDTESKWTLSEALEEVKEHESRCISCVHHTISENNKHWCKRYACGAWAALIGCQYKGFIDKFAQEEKTNNSDVTDTRCLHCWYSFLDDDNYLWCKKYHIGTESAIKKCKYEDFIDETDENKCADCKHYWYCAGEECCNLDKLSFPKPCNKFEREDYEKC